MSRTNRKYSPEFKIEVIETKHRENLSQSETARRFNLFINVNGYKYPDSNRIRAWERIYLTEGKEGFYIERRGRRQKVRLKKSNLYVTSDYGSCVTEMIKNDLQYTVRFASENKERFVSNLMCRSDAKSKRELKASLKEIEEFETRIKTLDKIIQSL